MTSTPATEIQRKVRQLDNDVTDIYSMLTSIQAGQQRQAHRIDEVDRKLHEHDARFDGITAKLVEHDARSMWSRASSMWSRASSMWSRASSTRSSVCCDPADRSLGFQGRMRGCSDDWP
ncbi:MAG: hypothetical protein IPH27_08255 [Actinomycetales bacterium]|nr:hypothetical protein [Candidatus Phosphoribacter baldrii]